MRTRNHNQHQWHLHSFCHCLQNISYRSITGFYSVFVFVCIGDTFPFISTCHTSGSISCSTPFENRTTGCACLRMINMFPCDFNQDSQVMKCTHNLDEDTLQWSISRSSTSRCLCCDVQACRHHFYLEYTPPTQYHLKHNSAAAIHKPCVCMCVCCVADCHSHGYEWGESSHHVQCPGFSTTSPADRNNYESLCGNTLLVFVSRTPLQ